MSKKADMMRDFLAYADAHGIIEYCTLVDSLRGSGNDNLFSFVIDEVVPVVAYIESKRRCCGYAPEVGLGDFLCV